MNENIYGIWIFTFEDENKPKRPVLFFPFPPLMVCLTLPTSGLVILLGVNLFPFCPSELCDSLKSLNGISEGMGNPDLYLSTTAFESYK